MLERASKDKFGWKIALIGFRHNDDKITYRVVRCALIDAGRGVVVGVEIWNYRSHYHRLI